MIEQNFVYKDPTLLSMGACPLSGVSSQQNSVRAAVARRPPAPPIRSLTIHHISDCLQDLATIGDTIFEPENKSSLNGRQDFVKQLISVCEMVWERVQHRLCADSPENAADNPEEDSGIAEKDTLAYSWRALRDSSLLLGAVLNTSYFCSGSRRYAATQTDYEKAGALCVSQLGSLRHRGAFSTVAQTFSTLCERVGSTRIESIWKVRQEWHTCKLLDL